MRRVVVGLPKYRCTRRRHADRHLMCVSVIQMWKRKVLSMLTCHVETSIACQEDNCAHEVFRSTHLTDRNERGPLTLKLRIVVKNLLRAIQIVSCVSIR